MKCPYCREDFVGPIPRGLHLWSRKQVGRRKVCQSVEEMVANGWYNHHGQWLTSKPEWIEQEANRAPTE